MAQHFYDGIIRRYINQVMRVFGNFVVKYEDGTLVQVPVLYGDADRQVANIIRQNSENIINSSPRISVYVTGLKLDNTRLANASHVSAVNIRERGIDSSNTYTNAPGRNYTVERLMPTPFMLSLKADIWTSSTDQKLQLMEQILVLFNPSLEIQTNNNFIDWTSLSVLNLSDITWSNKSIPVGPESNIEYATISLDTPIWLSPPVKVKHLGVITRIVANSNFDISDPMNTNDSWDKKTITVDNFKVIVNCNHVILVYPSEIIENEFSHLDIPVKHGSSINWDSILNLYPSLYFPNASRIYLQQPGGSEVSGTISVDEFNNSILTVNWDLDTLVSNTGIDSNGKLDIDIGYTASASFRPLSPGTFDAIIDPTSYNPKRPNNESSDQLIPTGKRFLIIEDISNILNLSGPDAWKSVAGIDFYAHANDIIEYTGERWVVIFDSNLEHDTILWQTNIHTNVQYIWNGVYWNKSFEGVYEVGKWRLVL